MKWDLRNTYTNNTEERAGALGSHTPSQRTTPTRTDPTTHQNKTGYIDMSSDQEREQAYPGEISSDTGASL